LGDDETGKDKRTKKKNGQGGGQTPREGLCKKSQKRQSLKQGKGGLVPTKGSLKGPDAQHRKSGRKKKGRGGGGKEK